MATLSPQVRRPSAGPSSYNGRGYATLNTRGGGGGGENLTNGNASSTYNGKKAVNYAGTMLGNGAAAAAAAASAAGPGDQPRSDASKYIVSPEQEAKNAAALATHV